MTREQLAHVLRAVSQLTGDPDVVVIGSQSILGSYSEDELPPEATGSMEVDTAFLSDPGHASASEPVEICSDLCRCPAGEDGREGRHDHGPSGCPHCLECRGAGLAHVVWSGLHPRTGRHGFTVRLVGLASVRGHRLQLE
jgi:hypothetical protein